MPALAPKKTLLEYALECIDHRLAQLDEARALLLEERTAILKEAEEKAQQARARRAGSLDGVIGGVP